MKFKENILLFVLLPLVVLTVGASYVRFMVIKDYLVAYEGVCDPVVNSCFVGCEDEECTSEYYYSSVQKYAVNLYAQCGEDITDCEAASICLATDDQDCSVTYCDPEVDGDTCSTPTESSTDINETLSDSTEIKSYTEEVNTTGL
jgi:hypothetical protein